MTSDNINDVMTELRKEYLDSFDEKFVLLEALYADKNMKAIESEYHKLKGTGKTYGLPEVSSLCEVLEKICANENLFSEQTLKDSIELLKSIRSKYEDGLDFDLESHPKYQELRQSHP